MLAGSFQINHRTREEIDPWFQTYPTGRSPCLFESMFLVDLVGTGFKTLQQQVNKKRNRCLPLPFNQL